MVRGAQGLFHTLVTMNEPIRNSVGGMGLPAARTSSNDTVQLLVRPDSRLQWLGCIQRKLAIGLVVVFVMAVSQTLSTELTSAGLSKLNAPFFTMWLHTSFMVFVFPITVSLAMLP